MEENDPRGTEGEDLSGATDEARRLALVADGEFASALDMIQGEAAALVSAAESDFEATTDLLRGQLSLSMDEATLPFVKYADKLAGEAAKTLTQAYEQLFSVGAEPITYGPLVAEDIERDDPFGSAMAQLIAPILEREGVERSWMPADGAAGDTFRAPDAGTSPVDNFVPTESVSVPPPPPFDPLPPRGTDLPPTVSGECPAPAVNLSCPAPQVVIVPMPPPCPVPVPPDQEDDQEEEEEEEPTSPGPPPDTIPPASGEPVVVAPPATPTAPPPPPAKPKFKPQIFPTPAIGVGGETNWTTPGYCDVLRDRSGFQPPAPTPPGAFSGGIMSLVSGLDSATGGIMGALLAGSGQSLESGLSVFSGLAEWGSNQTAAIVAQASSGCPGLMTEGAAAVAAASWAERITGAPATYLAQGSLYDVQYCSPQFLPSQSQVNGMRLANTITDELWECLTRANGNHPWAQRLVMTASRERPNTQDLIALYRRGQMTFDDLFGKAKENGITNVEELRELIAAGDYIPGYQDITRFMVRDVFDRAVFEKRQYDKGFAEKYQGQAKEWARANGISDDVMLAIWRAHWRTPSYTQGVEMFHRLRPGKPGVQNPFSKEDLAEMLAIDDMAPGYIDQMIEMSYNPVTRTDLLQFFTNGAINEEQAVSGLMDTGYSEKDARFIAESWRVEKSNRVANRAGTFTRRVIIRSYKEGEIDRDQARALLARSIPSEAEREQMLDDADLLRKVERKRKCIKAIRRKRITGEIDERESRRELVAQGMDVIHADEIAVGWTCEVETQSKEPRAQWVIDWFISGIVDIDTARKRLRNLRYNLNDIEIMLATAIQKEDERRAKLAQQQAEKAERRAKEAAREAERRAEKAKKLVEELQGEAGAGAGQ